MNVIQTPISAEPVSNFKRVAFHENFVVTKDLDMVQQVRVVVFDENDQPILERIAVDGSLTPIQKQNLASRYQDQIITRQTAGAFVDLAGKVVAADEEGAISQLDFFQHITLGDMKKMGMTINDKTYFASLLYAMVLNEMVNIDSRGGF